MKNLNKKIKLLDLNFKKNLGNDFFGLYKSKFHGVGMEFAELKEYNFGDSIKNIDWKSSARKGKIFSKKMEEERDLKILFILDKSETMNFGSKIFTKKEVLEQIFYAIALSANSSGDGIGGFIFDEKNIDFTPVKKGKENIIKIISKLNSEKDLKKNNEKIKRNKNNYKIKNIFEKIHKFNLKNNLIFILTDDINFGNNKKYINNLDEKLLRIISKENEVVFINIFDDFELNLFGNSSENNEDFGNNLFENFSGDFSNGKNFSGFNFLEKIFGIKNNYQKDFYKKSVYNKLNFLENFYKKKGCEYLKLNICGDYFKDLIRFFKKR